MRTLTLILLTALVGLTGCVGKTPMAQITEGRQSLTAVTQSAIAVYKAEKFSDESFVLVVRLIEEGRKALDRAEAAVRNGEKPETVRYFIDLARMAVTEVLAMQLQAERNGTVAPASKPAATTQPKGTPV